jgi:serine/threonine protein kinase
MVIALSQSNPSGQPHPWSGRLVGEHNRYCLDERLGSGGMGDVFLATDTRLGKLVALKLLRESLASADDLDFRERFERECAICAALKSLHIVQVSDYGLTSEGYPFYVMEYLQGQTLADLLATQPRLSVTRTCNIITQVCAGLQLAHEGVVLWSGEAASSQRIRVIHRDLKPANIFLMPMALGELIKIIDFGIAKIHSLQAEYTSATSVFLGTCHYASPEQFELQREVDGRSDIYSLGIILYEMLAGTDPFGFNFRTERVSNDAWLMAHASKSPQPLRSHPDCDHIPPQIEAVVMRCLEKSPENRFTSVAELSQALQAASSASPMPPLPPTPPTGVKPPPVFSQTSHSITPQSPTTRKFPRLLAAGSAVLLALAVGTFIAPRLWQSTAPQVSQAPQSTSPIHQMSLAKTLSGNASPVWSAVLSPDGQTLISGGEDRDTARQFYPIKIWNLNSGQVLRTLDDHREPIRSLSLSGNGQILASGSADKTIKIWNRTTGRLLQTLEGHTEPVWSVALSRDGQTAISGSVDKTVRIWDLQTGTSRVLSEHTATVYSVALNPNGKTIASSSEDKTIRLWDVATGELIRTLGEPGGHRDVVRAVAFSPNGKLLVSAGWDGFVKLWDSTTGQLLQTFAGHSDRVVSATFISDRAIASASLDNTIRLWDAQTGQPLQTIPAHSNWVLSVTAQLATQTLISSSNDTTIKIWR